MKQNSLWGEDFSTSIKNSDKNILKKISSVEEGDIEVEKILKSKKTSIEDKLTIIADNVNKILGHYKDNTVVFYTKEELDNYLDKSIKEGIIAIDTETNNSLDPLTCKLMGVCLYVNNLKQVYVPVNHIDYKTGIRLENQLTEQDIHDSFQKLLNSDVKIIMHNGKFDYQVIKCTCGVELPIYWDTLIAARLLDENEEAGLKYQYIKHIDSNQEKYSIEHLFEKEKYEIFSPELFSLYAATDSYMTYKLYEYQKNIFGCSEMNKVYNLFRDIEMPLVKVTAEMELNGVEIDLEYAERLSEKYHKKLEQIENQIEQEMNNLKPQIDVWKLSEDANHREKTYGANIKDCDESKIEELKKKFPYVDDKGNFYKLSKSKVEQLDEKINISSPTQIAILLYDVLKVESVDKKSPRATGEDALKLISQNTNLKICDLILEHRECSKLLGTYIDIIPELSKQWSDHRVRTHFNQCGTDTGRFSSSKPLNLQNIPSHNKEIRLMFKARENYVLIGSDYSAQEPRLTAFYSQDENMINAYKEGKDLYAVIAQKMFNNRYEDNLEFYPEGTEIELDGKKIICGNKTHLNKEGKERRSNAKTMLLG